MGSTDVGRPSPLRAAAFPTQESPIDGEVELSRNKEVGVHTVISALDCRCGVNSCLKFLPCLHDGLECGTVG